MNKSPRNSEIVALFQNKASLDNPELQKEWEATRALMEDLETRMSVIENSKRMIAQVAMIHEGWALSTTKDGNLLHYTPVDRSSNPRYSYLEPSGMGGSTFRVVLYDSFRDSRQQFILGEDFDKETAIEICKDWAGPGLLPQNVKWGKPVGVVAATY